MIRTLLVLSLAVTTVLIQAQQPKQEKPPAQSAPAAQAPKVSAEPAPAISPSQPVITIHGLCIGDSVSKTAATPDAATCTRAITKEEFEKVLGFLNANSPRLTPPQRRQIAQGYVAMLAYADVAKKAGKESDPKFVELMEFLRMRTLAETYKREQQEKYGTPTPQQIEDYYKQNVDKFIDVKVRRMYIPKNNPSPAKPVTDAKAAEEGDPVFAKKAEQVAHDIRERAAKGEDPTALAKEAYAALGITSAPASSDAFSYRKGTLPAEEEQEFLAAGPGAVSRVQAESAGYLIYELESNAPRPIDQVKAQVSSTLSRQILEEKTNEVMSPVQSDLNDQYFGPPQAAQAPGAPQPHGVVHPPGAPKQ
jgi:parvulin-like peptidyl-prolyl isomerase